MATRRGFLAGLTALTLPRLGWADVGNPAWLAAGKTGETFVLHGLSSNGESAFTLDLPARGHAGAAHPSRPEAVAFARRPGTFALVMDCFSGKVRHHLTPPEGRQFNGHGAFAADGGLLLTSEVVSEGSQGRIGVWETGSYRRIGEWSSGGIGPHDMKLIAGGRLVIANGGIETDPADRRKLNIATMRPNLTLLDLEGRVLAQQELPLELRQNSIRHLALTGGKVAFAMQWEGDPAEAPPLLGLWTLGEGVELCEPKPEEAFVMQGYAGSIAAHAGMVAISSPRGGAVMVFSDTGAPLVTHRRADICGLAPMGEGFLASDGAGGLWQIGREEMTQLRRADLAWDNHIVAIG